jgi:hypothetical protein
MESIPAFLKSSSMELYFTKDSPLNTSLVNSDSQTLYNISSPFKFPIRTTTVRKVVRDWREDENDKGDIINKFLLVAQIDWKSMGSNKLRFGGIEHDANTFLTRKGAFLQ